MADPGAQINGVAFLSVEASDQLIWAPTLFFGFEVAAALFGSHLENFELIFEISTQALLHDFLETFWRNYYRRGWLIFWLLGLGGKAFSARRKAFRAIEVVIHVGLVLILVLVKNFAKIVVDALLLSILVHN